MKTMQEFIDGLEKVEVKIRGFWQSRFALYKMDDVVVIISEVDTEEKLLDKITTLGHMESALLLSVGMDSWRKPEKKIRYGKVGRDMLGASVFNVSGTNMGHVVSYKNTDKGVLLETDVGCFFDLNWLIAQRSHFQKGKVNSTFSIFEE